MIGSEVGQHMALKRLHYRRGQGDGPALIKSCGPLCFGDGGEGGGFEAGRHMACLQRVAENETAERHASGGGAGVTGRDGVRTRPVVFESVQVVSRSTASGCDTAASASRRPVLIPFTHMWLCYYLHHDALHFI